MKYLASSLLLLLTIATEASAQKLDNFTRATITAMAHVEKLAAKPGDEKAVRKHAKVLNVARAIDHKDIDRTEYYPLVIEINDEQAIDLLNSVDAEIYYRRGNFLLAAVPCDAIGVIGDSSFVNVAAMSRPTACTIDVARSFANVDALHTGNETIAGLDGSGVVTGICDIGFDASHIAFRDRLAMKSTYDEYYADRSVYAPGSSLQNTSDLCVCDSEDETHATHTTNIMAGGKTNNPYYGVAPGSTLAVSTSSLTEMSLLCGIEDVIAYAKEQNMPAVVNLSVSDFIGPHDGTDLVNRYLDLLGQEAIICFSAGNYGANTYCLQYDFTAENKQVGSMIENSNTWLGFDIEGYMDFWSNDSRSFEMQFVAYDKRENKYIYESDWFAGDEEGLFDLENGDNDVWDAAFPDSYMFASWGVDVYNDRYNLTIIYNINPTETISDSDNNARYICGWRIRGQEGMHLDAFSDGFYSTFRRHGLSDMQPGNSLCSISNLCCGHNVISVGSCNSRTTVPNVDGDDIEYSFTANNVSSWSSYGTLVDGRSLPHICAPGNKVVSAESGIYYKNYPSAYKVSYQTEVDGETYRWIPWSGTSMSSPLVSGIMALWLQAVPTLTVEQAIEAAQKTARTDFSDITDPRWGAGCIDAFAGLNYLLQNDGVANVEQSQDYIKVEGRRIVSTSPVTVFDMQGRVQATDRDLVPGIYVARTSTATRKIIIR